MKPGDLILLPEGFDSELCLVLSVSPGNTQVHVFNSTRGRDEKYRWDWMRKHGEVISESCVKFTHP